MSVIFLGQGGLGGEAIVNVELRTEFPGIGGTIHTQQALPVAMRIENSGFPGIGRKRFFVHTIIKKLEDYFFRTGVYSYSHIPRPLGSVDSNGHNAYMYEWVFGSEGFPWLYYDDNYDKQPVKLVEWREFASAFEQAGIDLTRDITEPECDGSKNIIHQMHNCSCPTELNQLWKRIDFGPSSILVDYKKLLKYTADNKESMMEAIRRERYNLVTLAARYCWDEAMVSRKELGMLEVLAMDYRISTLHHLTAWHADGEGKHLVESFAGDESL